MHHIPILENVFFPLHPQLAGFFGAGFALAGEEVIVANRRGGDKAALKIRVDHRRRLGGFGAFGNRPRPGFLGASGEIGEQAKAAVRRANDGVKARLLQAEGLQKLALIG